GCSSARRRAACCRRQAPPSSSRSAAWARPASCRGCKQHRKSATARIVRSSWHPPLVLQAISRLVLLVPLVGACGKKTAAPVTKQDAGAGKTVAAPIALPPLGVDRISRFNFLWNEGGNAYDKANAAYKAKTRDWAAVRSACELAVQKDPQHLDA